MTTITSVSNVTMAANATTEGMLFRLMQLASPALPVGAYSYSQGLEAAVESGGVSDAESAERWIGDVLEFSVASMEAPLLLCLCGAWRAGDVRAAQRYNALFLAGRESAELRAESVQMGYSLARLLPELGAPVPEIEEVAFPTAFACAAAHWEIAPRAALAAYLWAWTENQVMAAIKAVPLGQTKGQKMLLALGARAAAAVERAIALDESEWCNFAPGLAMLSARHETQYSRLFRS